MSYKKAVQYDKRSLPTKFRITPHYTNTFKAMDNYQDVINKIVQPSLDYWSFTLKAKTPEQNNFHAQWNCVDETFVVKTESGGLKQQYCTSGCSAETTCYTESIPREYLDSCREYNNGAFSITIPAATGIPNTDYLMFIDAKHISECNQGLLAFAVTCQIDNRLNRPEMGYINFCPNAIDLSEPNIEMTYGTALHEIAHALGFSPSLYAFMRDESGNPRTLRDPSTEFPNLGQESDGTYIPSWYDVDMSRAGKWAWGKGLGCDFVQKSCYEYMKINTDANKSIKPYCKKKDNSVTECVSFDNAFGQCNLLELASELPEEYQYFTSLPEFDSFVMDHVGGRDDLMDYCPYVEPYMIKNSPTSFCSHVTNKVLIGDNAELQFFGNSSLCINHDSSKQWTSQNCQQKKNFVPKRASCHRHLCSPKYGLMLKVGSTEIQCPLAGGKVSLNSICRSTYLDGDGICPACSDVCNNCPAQQVILNNQPVTKPDPISCC